MAEFPALPLFTDAFMADTMHLTAAQTGAYLMLLMVAWRTSDCALPDDHKLLARYARMDQRTWNANNEIILSFWKKDGSGKWYQARLSDERKRVEDKRNKNVDAGKASALKRHNTRSTPVQPEFNVNPTIPEPEPYKKEDAVDPRANSGIIDAVAGVSPTMVPPRSSPKAGNPETSEIPPNSDTISQASKVFELGEQLAEIVGWKDDPNWFGNYSRLAAWLEQGTDFHLDILPTFKRVMAKKTGPPPSTLAYFEKAIADAKAQRLKPMPKGNENAAPATRQPSRHATMLDDEFAAYAEAARLAKLQGSGGVGTPENGDG